MAKYTSMMARGSLGTSERSSASGARNLATLPTSSLTGPNIGETHANGGTEETFDDEMDRIISTLKIDANVNYLFEGFAMVTNRYTNSYQDAALTTRNKDEKSVTYVRSAEAFH